MEQKSPGEACRVNAAGTPQLEISCAEDNIMRHFNGYIRSLFLVGAFMAPAAMLAAPTPQVGVQVRVYDRDHRDYHNWDDREDHAYRRYMAERRREYREYNHQNRRDQRRYWNWRHSHPDRD